MKLNNCINCGMCHDDEQEKIDWDTISDEDMVKFFDPLPTTGIEKDEDKISDKCNDCVHFFKNGFCRYCKLKYKPCQYEKNDDKLIAEDLRINDNGELIIDIHKFSDDRKLGEMRMKKDEAFDFAMDILNKVKNLNKKAYWQEATAMPPISQIQDVVKFEINNSLYDHPQIVEFIDVLNNFGEKLDNIKKTLNTLLDRDVTNTTVNSKHYDNIIDKLDDILNVLNKK